MNGDDDYEYSTFQDFQLVYTSIFSRFQNELALINKFYYFLPLTHISLSSYEFEVRRNGRT